MEGKLMGAIRSLANAISLQLECARKKYEALLGPVLLYGSEKERSRIRAVKMDKLRSLLGIIRINSAKSMGKKIVWIDEGMDERTFYSPMVHPY